MFINRVYQKLRASNYSLNPIFKRMIVSSTSEKHVENYDQLSKTIQGRMADNLLSKLKINADAKCLDIGCGTGDNTTSKLLEKVKEVGQVIAFDPDQKRLNAAKKKYNHTHAKFTCGTITDLDLKQETIDVAVSNMVFHWIPPEGKLETLHYIHKVLKKDGLFAFNALPKMSANVLKILPYLGNEMKKKFDEITFFLDEKEYQKLFNEVGFDIIAFDVISKEVNLPSVDSYLNLVDATLYGLFDFKYHYDKFSHKIDLSVDADGKVFDEFTLYEIILKKSSKVLL